MEGRYFELSVRTKRYDFKLCTNKMNVVLDALEEASINFNFDVDLDEIIELLCEMKNGRKNSTETFRYRIAVRDGEI